MRHSARNLPTRSEDSANTSEPQPFSQQTSHSHSNTCAVDVMITIFGDFCQFSPKKMAFFSKTNVMIKIFHNLALFRVKNANFFAIFLAKIF
jgi:hypothetical protein